jgi:farnesyl-diphosphate farnesyltransferase
VSFTYGRLSNFVGMGVYQALIEHIPQICLYYLVLRGLDTIEDDMSIPDDIKQPLLRSFHEKIVTPGWTFNGNGPDEKDRQLLVEYNVLVDEVNLLKPEWVHISLVAPYRFIFILFNKQFIRLFCRYRNIIVDICRKMETGMADFTHHAATTDSIYLDKVEDYDLYCHYVAGLVGEGLSRLWSASGKEVDSIRLQLELSNSMGILLQKTNIIRDYREDCEEHRYFWPREIWGKYDFKEMKEMYEPANKERAAWAQSGMILDALRHATDSLDYLRLLKNQSVFNFCAIPATMALATLELCFMNPEMLQRNIKIRKAAAAKVCTPLNFFVLFIWLLTTIGVSSSSS